MISKDTASEITRRGFLNGTVISAGGVLLANRSLAGDQGAPRTGIDGSASLQAFKSAIRAQYDLKESAFRNRLPDTIANDFYSEDAVGIDVSGNVYKGREALRALARAAAPTVTSVRFESVWSHVDGKCGWDWVNCRVVPSDSGEMPYSLIFLFLWEKRHQKWWCVGDIFVKGSIAQ